MDAWSSRARESVKNFLRPYVYHVRYLATNPLSYMYDLNATKRRGAANLPESAGRQVNRVLLLSDLKEYTSEAQFGPFFRYRDRLRSELGIVFVHARVADVLAAPRFILGHFDTIVLKLSYKTPAQVALDIAQKIRAAAPTAKFVYFDGDDDLGVQWPEILPLLDTYVKKHMLADIGKYNQKYLGKSSLHDYVARTYGHVFTNADYSDDKTIYTSGPVPEDQLAKLSLGYNIGSDTKIMDFFARNRELKPRERQNDIVFRGNVPPKNIWIYYLRGALHERLAGIANKYKLAISNKRVSQEEYYDEMRNAKICLSPFGFGELCWRDFEAVICGSLLIKPNMDHLKTYPNIFVPFVTYVPVKWDFSDLEEKCDYYLNNPEERERITRQAFEVLRNYYDECGFIGAVAPLLAKTRVAATEPEPA